ncbi:hypothetical protein CONCODRAFT_19680 [Conidiobolus coronatus NRRL 28638]|uniref:Transcription factor domain-containing protein n=1 Tax=Conidiobolus coronatus (strain ATCC 28846 / CBS 209.66 / NRRL 28638) TaxID=796925 RepID=A0A137NXE6_CONC2|nr:hypothetical protein CONCODRAFT_19680 [Conidiobolus coronatus NRRL 28638]|eukprot:KXN67338.1 hypothetical protein CONCODRAFT_19680 [Conidiobolus coronatus NRRL 28638]
MDQVIDLVEVRSCFKCRVETKSNLKYCKKCAINTSFTTQFYSYEFKKTKIGKKPLKVAIEFPLNPQLTRELDIIYYISPLEKSVFTNLKLTRFQNLTHLTNYILYSNQVPNTQLIYHLSPDLKNIPQIKQILDKNEKIIDQYISSISIPNNRDPNSCICSNSLNLVNDPNFWTELIKLYIEFCLPSDDLLFWIPAPIPKASRINSIHESIIQSKSKKDSIHAKFANIQALYIYCQVLFNNGEISLTRNCFATLSRMLYALGIHLDAAKFDLDTNFNRKLILRRVSIFDISLAGTYKFYPNYIVELPKFSNALYDINWYLTPSKWSKFEEKESIKEYLEASITVIKNKFYDKTCNIIDFTINSSTKALRNDKLVKTKLKSLNLAYSEVLGHSQNLKWSYPQQVKIIEKFELSVKVSYIHLSLILLECWKLNKQGKNPQLTQKTLKFSIGLFELISQSESYKTDVFYYYLLGFSLLSNIKDFDKEGKSKALEVLEKLKVIVEQNHHEFNNLNLLLLGTGLKLLN